MADPVTVILGGVVVSFVSGGVGAFVGSFNRVRSSNCKSNRESCLKLVELKLTTLDGKMDKVIKALNNKGVTII